MPNPDPATKEELCIVFIQDDGLMVQCDLCLCWQHGWCYLIQEEGDAPSRHICDLCASVMSMNYLRLIIYLLLHHCLHVFQPERGTLCTDPSLHGLSEQAKQVSGE